MSVTMQEQAHLSGLHFLDRGDGTEPKLTSSKSPDLMDASHGGFAWIVLDQPGQIFAVTGGSTRMDLTNSVMILNAGEETKMWQEGPTLNEARSFHAAVVCNGGVYELGGDVFHGFPLDTIERIDIDDLLQVPSADNSKKWTTLN